MKTYIANFIPQFKQFSEKLDNKALLMNQHWVMVDDTTNTKTVYIFKADNRLLLSTNGKVNHARWEMIDSEHVLVSIGDDSYMFKHGFLNEGILALNLDGGAEYALFVNENAEQVCGLRSPQQLEDYLDQKQISDVESSVHVIDNGGDGGGDNDLSVIFFVLIAIVIIIMIVAMYGNQ